MKFFTGHGDPNSPDFHIEQFRGMFVSEDGKTWGNRPFTKKQRMYEILYDHCAANLRTFRDEYELVMQKKSTLSASVRAYLIYIIEESKEGDLV